jgi:3-oxoacyl-[acyl-carrier protein] reductase
VDLGLNGKVALVAAASRGLGKAIALGLAREGAKLAICSRIQSAIDAAAQEITAETGTEVLAMAGDVRQGDTCSWLVHHTVERFGRLDVLVANAGGPPFGSAWQMSDEQWQSAFETNLLSTVRLVREAVPYMRAAGGGRIINVISTGVREPIPNLVLSNAVRAAVVNFAKTLAVELAADNILVNSLGPGRINTDRILQMDENNARNWGVSLEEARRRQEEDIPMKRAGTPEEFANVAVFLASDKASYVTGQTIMVDGARVRSIF